MKTDFFDSAEIDFLMAQPDGCKLVLDKQKNETNNGTSIGTDTGTKVEVNGGTILGHCPTEIDIDIELEKEKRKKKKATKFEFLENKIAVIIHILDVIAKARSPCYDI